MPVSGHHFPFREFQPAMWFNPILRFRKNSSQLLIGNEPNIQDGTNAKLALAEHKAGPKKTVMDFFKIRHTFPQVETKGGISGARQTAVSIPTQYKGDSDRPF